MPPRRPQPRRPLGSRDGDLGAYYVTNTGSFAFTFTAGSASANSSPTRWSARGSVTQLVWATQPGGAVNGEPFGTQPVVETADIYGNPSTNGLSLTNTLTLSQVAGSGALSGTTNYNIGIGTSGSNGVVTCSGLAINTAGAGAQLLAAMVVNSAPTNIPNCILWLDAADTGTLTLSGTSITTWKDKSGTANNATGGTAPTFGTNATFAVNTPGLGRAAVFNNSAFLNVTLSSLVGSPYTVCAMEINNGPTGQSFYLGTQTAGTDGGLQVGYKQQRRHPDDSRPVWR